MELIRSLSSPSGVPVGACSIWASLSESDTAKVGSVTEAYQGCFKSAISCQTFLLSHTLPGASKCHQINNHRYACPS